MFGMRAASCPKCLMMFEGTAKERQRCPSCGHRFTLPKSASGAGSGFAGDIDGWDQASQSRRALSRYSRQDRVLSGAIVALASVFTVWLGGELGAQAVVFAGAAGLAMILISAAVSGLWGRYNELSPGARTLADLPRLLVWTVGRFLAALLEAFPV